jgi:hypothetical protein
MSFINKMMYEINQGGQPQTTNKASDVGQQSLNEIFGEKAAPDTLGQFQQRFNWLNSPQTGLGKDLILPGTTSKGSFLNPYSQDEITASPERDPITGMPFNELTGAPTEASDEWLQSQGFVRDPETGELYKPDFPLGSAGGQPTYNPEFNQEMQRQQKDSNVETSNKESINDYFKGINWQELLQGMLKRP